MLMLTMLSLFVCCNGESPTTDLQFASWRDIRRAHCGDRSLSNQRLLFPSLITNGGDSEHVGVACLNENGTESPAALICMFSREPFPPLEH